MIVIRQHDSSAAPYGADHLPHDLFRLLHVFQHEARMGHIEPAPLAPFERQRQCVTLPPFDQIRLARASGLPLRFTQLFLVSFDAQGVAVGLDPSGHGTRELSEPAANVEHDLARFERQLAQASLIEQVIQVRQPLLFRGRRTVNVALALSASHPVDSHFPVVIAQTGSVVTINAEAFNISLQIERAKLSVSVTTTKSVQTNWRGKIAAGLKLPQERFVISRV